MPLKKILIANRGEIACRVIRTCREMGIAAVAIYSDADRAALHVLRADEAFWVGPPPSRESYLAIDRILEAARQSGADAVHPGYGFLSENPVFARACERSGLALIGPPASAMEAMGEKTRARDLRRRAGVPVVPGSPGPIATEEEALTLARQIGFPVMIKAAAGGGGKGMRKVEGEAAFLPAFRAASSEAQSAFGDGRVYLERFLEKPRHVEVQVFADAHGTCIHLAERECSVQRRHQKVIEETPSPVLTPELREQMGAIAVRAAQAVGYVGAGTVEFLVDAHRNFYFLEMNTRLQVEHPITEWVTGVDLVRWQIQVAGGEPLPVREPILQRGHAVEARVYAEDPAHGFMPSPGRIERLSIPSGPWVRDDGGVYAGYEVPLYYDPLISKLSVWAPSRAQALARLRRALSEYVVTGIPTNLAWLQRAVRHPELASGDYDTGFVERHGAQLLGESDPESEAMVVVASALWAHRKAKGRMATAGARQGREPSAWKQSGRLRAVRRF
ncbi:MAG: acetyl-CoA carboxylase biotin carboxylase subunit [Deltaproteobacteria bacterium]|nr:acetyl-CoA carboxylase biotin carboxylase subunit [Deltaproteobacteria bacterium]